MKPTLLIVDDEPKTRSGLAALIGGRSDSWELLDPCANGAAALEVLRARRVDLLLTDVRMPGIDGLHLTEEALKLSPELVVLIISGYKEFEYAKRAIEYGVVGFVVKPVDEEELLSALDRARAEVDRRALLRESETSSTVSGSVKDALLFEVIGSERGGESEVRLAEALHLAGRAYAISCLRLSADQAAERSVIRCASVAAIEVVRRSVRRELHRAFDPATVELLIFHNILCAVVRGASAEECAQLSERVRSLFSAYCAQANIPHVAVGASSPRFGVEKLASGLREAIGGLADLFYEGSISAAGPTRARELSVRQAEALKERYVSCLTAADSQALSACTEELLEVYARLKLPLSSLDEQVRLLIGRIRERAGSALIDLETLRETFDELVPVSRYWSFASFAQEFSRHTAILCERAARVISGRVGRSVRQALRYVEQNYGHDLPLEEVAREVGLSPAYFSTHFKRETGRSFVEYLTEFRVEKAKELLTTTSLRTLDVAHSVGCRDPKYFARIFKKSVGVTPSRYRRFTVAD